MTDNSKDLECYLPLNVENLVDYDPTKWNASCDLLHEMIVRPNAEMRGVIREELCCHELNAARAEVLQFIKRMRK